jgi:glycine/D-amino acid oxidase-like deaminating enzyme
VRRRHAFVLGSGIAGLSLAEVLTRNGWTITLLDTASELGGDASRSTQNWFHTGWLYAAMPTKDAMLGCYRALKLFRQMYGRVLPREILNLEFSEGAPGYPASEHGWFSSERVHYVYATAATELSRLQRLTWKRHLEEVAFRRLRALGYATEATQVLDPDLTSLLNYWEGEPRGHESYTVVRSTDARINTRRVLNTLLSLLGDNAQVYAGAEYSLGMRGNRTSVRIDGEIHVPDLVVMATGRSIADQLTELGYEKLARCFKSVCSPIVVLDRALELPNFIRFTPNLPATVNHIKYEIEGVGLRSTLGSYDYFPVDSAPDISPFVSKVCNRLDVPVSHVASTYYGTKTEFTGPSERRYNHALERVNDNTYFAIPGKFSQFPLLAHEFSKRVRLDTGVVDPARGVLRMQVAATAAERGHVASRDQASLNTA